VAPARSPENTVVDPDIAKSQPEIVLTRRLPEPQPFQFTTSLLDAHPSTSLSPSIPLPGAAVAFDPTGLPTQWDYDGESGGHSRFGFVASASPPTTATSTM